MKLVRFTNELTFEIIYEKILKSTAAADVTKCVCIWERVNPFPHIDAF